MPDRPPLVYRVGITGARDLAADGATLAQIEAEVARALAAIETAVAAAALQPQARRVYRTAADGTVRPILRMVSPLAEGADRLAARLALADGWELECPLPFPPDEYIRDFPETASEFAGLLAQADGRVLALDGAAADPLDSAFARHNAYRAVGRTVVRHCDLVLALWNGKPGRGIGGTSEILGFAAESGPKAWWIDLREPTRHVLIDNNAELRWATRPGPEATRPANAPPEGEAAFAALARHIEATLLPPPPPRHHPHGVVTRLIHRVDHGHNAPPHPLDAFLAATHPKQRRPALFFRLFFMPIVGGPPRARGESSLAQHWGRVRDLAIRVGKGVGDLVCPPAARPSKSLPSVGPVQDYWSEVKASTDSLANATADRHRSTYVGVFSAAALSVIFGAIAEITDDSVLFGLLELLSLGVILALVVAHHRGQWQERWIGCRVLAEYCRIQRNLAPLGWGIVGGQLAVPIGPEDKDPPRDAWIGWYFHAVLRAAPLHAGSIDATLKRNMLTQVVALATEQSDYHEARHTSHDRASRRLATAGEAFFVATTIAVFLKVVIAAIAHALGEPLSGGNWLAALCTILPAISAALVGIRAYAEFDMLSWQSRRMRHAMLESLQRMRLIQPERPLASDDIGLEMSRLAAIMLEDTAGWAQLFGGKAVEAG